MCCIINKFAIYINVHMIDLMCNSPNARIALSYGSSTLRHYLYLPSDYVYLRVYCAT